ETTGDFAGRDRLIRSRVGFGLLVQTPLMWAAGFFFLGGQPLWLIAVYIVSVPCLVAGVGCQSVLLIENRTAATAKTVLIAGVVAQVAVVVVAAATKSADPVWAVRLASTILAPAFAALLVTKAVRRLALQPRIPRNLPPGFWRFALFSWVAAATAVLVYSRS